MKFFKNRQGKKVRPVEPRSMEAITAEYNTLVSQAGQVQYTVMVYQRDLDRLNNRLQEVNNEAAERNKLDKAAEEANKGAANDTV